MKPEYPEFDVHVLVTTEDGCTFAAKRLYVGDEWVTWVTATTEDDAHCPYDWTNGVMWKVNETGKPSTPVVTWDYIT